jgi:hypothetical protein
MKQFKEACCRIAFQPVKENKKKPLNSFEDLEA